MNRNSRGHQEMREAETEVQRISIHVFSQTRKCNGFCHLGNRGVAARRDFENIREQLQACCARAGVAGSLNSPGKNGGAARI